MNMTKLALLGTITILICPQSSHASLTSADWMNPNDNLLTLDSGTGLAWLDWSFTANRSYNNVFAQLAGGGEFEGFRYATEDEIRGLYASAGAPNIPFITVHDAANIPAMVLLHGLVGDTFGNGAEAIYDLPGPDSVNDSDTGNWGGSGPYHMGTAFSITGQLSPRWINYDDNNAESWMGHALVQVPTPSTLLLLTTAGLCAARRRR